MSDTRDGADGSMDLEKYEKALQALMSGGSDYRDIETLQEGFARGFRLSAITELVQSSKPSASSTGVFLLEELNFGREAVRAGAAGLLETGLHLSRSPDGWRRKVFIDFAMGSRITNGKVRK